MRRFLQKIILFKLIVELNFEFNINIRFDLTNSTLKFDLLKINFKIF